MKVLILGGTLFLGRHIVEAALNRGHEVTLFNRGHTRPDLFANIEKLHGDRTKDLRALEGRTWDAVIDTCGYVPRVVQNSAAVLKSAIGHYTFISTISVYADLSEPGLTEDAPVHRLAESTEEVGPLTYGPLKALCEQTVEALLPGRTLIVRPGLLVGPDDPTGRFTYWVSRVASGGEILAPGELERQVQFIDARDAACWIVRMTEEQRAGVFHITGPQTRLSMGELLETCRQTLNVQARFSWVAEAFLERQGVRSWTDLPLWVSPRAKGLLAVDITKALGAGLTFRPLADTILDTFRWASQLAPERNDGKPLASGASLRAGLEPAREAQLLRDWKQTHISPSV